MIDPTPDRRRFLALGAGAAGLLAFPRVAFAAAGGGDRRLVFIIQRGAADGLAIVQPTGDPAYAPLRGRLVVPDGLALGSDFMLHPALVRVGALYGRGEALFVHAAASPYRDRSHFDGQNVLETGGIVAYGLSDGWLNRLAVMLPRHEALSLSLTVPLGLRGAAPVTSYAPSKLPQPSDDLLARVRQLYAGDPELHGLWEKALSARGIAGDTSTEKDAAALGATTAAFLARADGPRIAMIETSGWDTHIGQVARLASSLRQLDGIVGALQDGMGPAWIDTLVIVATEFGRTAAANGTGGTDHGTGSAAMLIGGGVRGGRVLADWPGLAPARLLDGRDLRPTMALDGVIAGAAAAHHRLDPTRVAATLFPAGPVPRPVEGLIRA